MKITLFAAGTFIAAMAGGAVTLAVVAALAVFAGAFGIIAFSHLFFPFFELNIPYMGIYICIPYRGICQGLLFLTLVYIGQRPCFVVKRVIVCTS